jgi:hypothetical protein
MEDKYKICGENLQRARRALGLPRGAKVPEPYLAILQAFEWKIRQGLSAGDRDNPLMDEHAMLGAFSPAILAEYSDFQKAEAKKKADAERVAAEEAKKAEKKGLAT